MLQIERHYHGTLSATERLTLPFELRQKSRMRCVLDSGEEAGLILERGTVLRGGDLLEAADGRIITVVAAPEPLSVVATTDPVLLARAAYHLGNRHVAVQVKADGLSFLHDHVLDAMLRGLGLPVRFEHAPFEPEGGAYGRHEHGVHGDGAHAPAQTRAHAHDHAHDPTHHHPHDHDHGHAHHH
jgi:urease accessory protein